MKFPSFLLAATLPWLLLVTDSHAQEATVSQLPLQLIDDVEIASLDPGIVQRIVVKQGTIVQQGDPLLKLDSELFESAVAAQEANLLVALADAESDIHIRFSEKSLALSEVVLKKSEAAIAEYAKSISQTELGKLRLERDQTALGLEKAEADRKKASLMVKVRSAELETARIQLRRRTILAPCDGVVVKIEAQEGEAVVNGQTVVRIINLDRLRLIASVDMELATRLSLDTPASFELELGGERIAFPAKVVFISPEIRFTDQSFDVWVEVENSERNLLPGMKGNLVLGASSHPNQSEVVLSNGPH